MTYRELLIHLGKSPPPLPPPKIVQTVIPFEQWPAWAKALAGDRLPEDRGVGDVLARKIPFGETFKTAFKAIFGVDCGCDARQESLNRRYPFPTATTLI